MVEAISDRVYRIYMFFFVPFALVSLAFPGRDPLAGRPKKKRAEKPGVVPVYLGPELGNQPYQAEVAPKRYTSHRRFALAR